MEMHTNHNSPVPWVPGMQRTSILKDYMPSPTGVKLERPDDSEEEIVNSAGSSSDGSPTDQVSPNEASPIDDHSTPTSPEEIIDPTEDDPVDDHAIGGTGRVGGPHGIASLFGGEGTLPGVLPFGAMNFANLPDMANKSVEEQTQLNAEIQNNLLQLIQVVANNAKAQLEEKERERKEQEEREKEEAEILEIIRSQLNEAQKTEISEFITDNPKVSLEDASILFSAKFSKVLAPKVIGYIRNSDSVGSRGWSETALALPKTGSSDSPKFKSRNSAFPEIEAKISELFDQAEAEGKQLSSKIVRQKALEYADMLGIKNFNASKGWLLKLLARQNRKLGRSVDHLQKRKPFIRLSFGEKHEIAKYITTYPDKTYPEYARYFSELWNRTVTARQIITTKENTDKWLDEAYKGCEQTHYKFVDEGSKQDGPMVMKRKRSRVILTPDEREEISNFLADNSEMTFNQTAEIFAKRWGKDVNRTHVASIMRLREKASQNTNSSNSSVLVPPSLFRKGPKPNPNGSYTPSLLPPPSMKGLPMSGLDLFNLNNDQTSPAKPSLSLPMLTPAPITPTQSHVGGMTPNPNHQDQLKTSPPNLSNFTGGLHTSPVTAAIAAAAAKNAAMVSSAATSASAYANNYPITSLANMNNKTVSSSSFSPSAGTGAAPISVIMPNHNIFNMPNKPLLTSHNTAAPPSGSSTAHIEEVEDHDSFSPKKQKLSCEKCPETFTTQASLIQHIISAPNHMQT